MKQIFLLISTDGKIPYEAANCSVSLWRISDPA
jgi:hypothetical protein